MTYAAAKQSLKTEICSCLTEQGLSKEIMGKVCQMIKNDAANGTYHTLSKFAPRHHAIVTSWIDRLSNIESENDAALEAEYNAENPELTGDDEALAHDYGYAATAKGRSLLRRI